MTAALEVRGLHYTYPDGHEALSGVDLSVATGERLALLGPNGSGKTTLALHINGIRTPSAGTVSVGGTQVTDETSVDIRKQVGLVFQDPNDQLFMPFVGEDVAFGPANMGLRGADLDVRVTTALEAVGGADLRDRVPHHLSGGERRRAAIATVLSMEPAILVLDEPTAGLDPAGRRELITLLASLDVTQIVITHDLPLALELCNRAAIMDGGVIAAVGRTSEILADTELLARHGLELPLGFDPARVVGHGDG